MRIVIKTRVGRDELQRQRMDIDGVQRLHVGPLCECPEDAIIERDLVSCDDVVKYMVEAHAAGLRGEEMVVHEITDDEEE